MQSVNIPAAQYVRMSREHQQYSIDNQISAIQTFAKTNGFDVVATYADAGKSGVSLQQRHGLTRLLQDVIGGVAPFSAILVYDVSRWGRFQDCDESAHYEFVCKRANIPVHYCAESFTNDCAMPSTAMKALKRMMAAEFSRELGETVFCSEKRWAQLGFKQGGAAPYALRRMLTSYDGTKKYLLGKGEVKYLQSDRVVLVPGEPAEVALVREIFRLVVEENKKPFQIARELNGRELMNRGSRWSHHAINRILGNQAYAGCYVWNKNSRRLGGATTPNPASAWIIRPSAFEAIIDPDLFKKAQYVLSERNCRKSNDRLLHDLRTVLQANGTLTGDILRKSPGAPSAGLMRSRFGNLTCAFELAGYRRSSKSGLNKC